MNEYIKFDPEFVKKFWQKLNKQERHCMDVYDKKCAKEVFVRRTLHRWFKGKCIAVILDKDTGGRTNRGNVTIKRKTYLAIGGFQYVLGHGEEINVYAEDPTETRFFNSNRLWEHQMKNLEFYEIGVNEFNRIYDLFKDDRPEKEFKAAGWNKDESKGMDSYTIVGKDVNDAIDRYYREHKIKLFDIDVDKLNKKIQK